MTGQKMSSGWSLFDEVFLLSAMIIATSLILADLTVRIVTKRCILKQRLSQEVNRKCSRNTILQLSTHYTDPQPSISAPTKCPCLEDDQLTSRSLFESRPPVVARHDQQRRGAFDGADRILSDDAQISAVVVTNFGNLKYVYHSIVAQTISLTL